MRACPPDSNAAGLFLFPDAAYAAGWCSPSNVTHVVVGRIWAEGQRGVLCGLAAALLGPWRAKGASIVLRSALDGGSKKTTC